MRVTTALFLLAFFHIAYGLPANALEIEGGQIVDVVVADSGYSDIAFVTRFLDGWKPEGPQSFDIGKDGSIYVLDQLGARVLKFDKDGRWISTFQVGPKELSRPGWRFKDIAVDNWGNFYVIRGSSIGKFSQTGEFLESLPPIVYKDGMRGGHVVYSQALTDKSGRFYNYGDQHIGGIVIYGLDGEIQGIIDRCEYEYQDIGIVQKELGDDVYFRVGKYLLKTTLKDFADGKKIDTVATLPDWIRLIIFADDKTWERGWVEYPYVLIGFDKHNCFYFHQREPWYCSRSRSVCLIHRISKFRLDEAELKELGEVVIRFRKGRDECSYKELWLFRKQFVVSGDGTIYFLHGTVDRVKVSKIIME